ncbi:acyl-CoA dehydrogenase family protein [Pseudonocardia xishanensis]|uniref:Acyl-CoA dehydrogenase/oxidase N-terminal domain-containing protein n=1 Tax=Pseudonocardia xishanensis TaxID=630995 RepID=A0ABP8S0P8_9PSEU
MNLNSDDLYPFRAAERLDFDIVDALLTHLPMLWNGSDGEHGAAPCAPTAVRDAWDALCSVGVGGLLVPAEYGGQGASLSRSLSVAWTLSRIPAPVPFLSSAVVAPLLCAALSERELLSEIATGDTVVAVAFGGRIDDGCDGGTTLHGEVDSVLHGSDAERWFVVASDGAEPTILAVDRPESTIRQYSQDVTRPLARARFDGMPARRLAVETAPLVGEIVRRAHLVRCVEALAAASIAVEDDPASMASIAAAITAVRSTAAATDLHGTCDSRQLDVACSRTAMVSRLVADTCGRGDQQDELRASLCAIRATGGSAWLPPELCFDDEYRPFVQARQDTALTAAGGSGGERRAMRAPRTW